MVILQDKNPDKNNLDEFKTLLYSLVHEINNIFSVVISNTEVLTIYLDKFKETIRINQNLINKKEISDFVYKSDDILKDNTEILSVLSEILENANDYLQKETYQFQEIILRNIVNENVVFLHKAFDFSVETIIDIKDDVKMKSNRSHVNILLRNIILNAFQSCKDTDKKRVRISGFKIDNEVIITVEDTGKGIPAEEIPFIFDPYYTTKQKDITHGLGLTICSNIVDHYNGSISVQSEVNQGTKIKIKLPARSEN